MAQEVSSPIAQKDPFGFWLVRRVTAGLLETVPDILRAAAPQLVDCWLAHLRISQRQSFGFWQERKEA